MESLGLGRSLEGTLVENAIAATQVAFQGASEVAKLVKLASASGYAKLGGPIYLLWSLPT